MPFMIASPSWVCCRGYKDKDEDYNGDDRDALSLYREIQKKHDYPLQYPPFFVNIVVVFFSTTPNVPEMVLLFDEIEFGRCLRKEGQF